MSTITLKYNSPNRIARETISYIQSLGILKTKEFESPFAEIVELWVNYCYSLKMSIATNKKI